MSALKCRDLATTHLMLDPLCPECLDSGPYPKAYTAINDIEPDISIAKNI
jgi:hypothetical protein